MAYKCAACGHQHSLTVKASIDLPADSRSDEIALQIIQCASCGFRGIAVYAESHRGALDDDSFEHVGYFSDEKSVNKLAGLIKKCPDPHNKRCSCQAHQTLSITDRSGRWHGLSLFEHHDPFGIG